MKSRSVKIIAVCVCIIIGLLWASRCSFITGESETIEGIYISESLILHGQEDWYSYSNLVERALEKDPQSIKKLATLKIFDGPSYDHGSVIVSIIERIGEEEFLRNLQPITAEEKSAMRSYIRVGLEYGSSKYTGKEPEESFPLLAKYLDFETNY